MSRESNSDNAKHGKSFTKAEASVQMPMWPTMGAWKAPGQVQVTPSTPANDDYQDGQRHESTETDY